MNKALNEMSDMALPVLRRRFDPFEEMKGMQKEMDEMFEKFFSRREGKITLPELVKAPLTDLEDRGESFVLTAELPGLEKKDIKIDVDPNSITVRGEKKETKEEKKKNYYYSERSYSGYKRTLALPAEVNPDEVEAEYKNGVLTVTMKKVEGTPKKKEVKVK